MPVISRIPFPDARLQLQDVVGDALEESPVVGDDQHAGVRDPEEVFQPFDRLQVEVIGRLVEEEKVGLLQEEAGQREPSPLSATQGARRERLVGLGESDAVEDLGNPAVIGVAVEPLVLVLHVAVLVDQARQRLATGTSHGVLQPLQTLAEFHDVGAAM